VKEAVVSRSAEAFRKGVLQDAKEERRGGEGSGLPETGPGVLVLEGDPTTDVAEDVSLLDHTAVKVFGKVLEGALPSASGLDVHDPFDSVKFLGVGDPGLPAEGQKLLPEKAFQHGRGKQVLASSLLPGAGPPVDAAAGHDDVQVGMKS
jgi:hypothetical protein